MIYLDERQTKTKPILSTSNMENKVLVISNIFSHFQQKANKVFVNTSLEIKQTLNGQLDHPREGNIILNLSTNTGNSIASVNICCAIWGHWNAIHSLANHRYPAFLTHLHATRSIRQKGSLGNTGQRWGSFLQVTPATDCDWDEGRKSRDQQVGNVPNSPVCVSSCPDERLACFFNCGFLWKKQHRPK